MTTPIHRKAFLQSIALLPFVARAALARSFDLPPGKVPLTVAGDTSYPVAGFRLGKTRTYDENGCSLDELVPGPEIHRTWANCIIEQKPDRFVFEEVIGDRKVTVYLPEPDDRENGSVGQWSQESHRLLWKGPFFVREGNHCFEAALFNVSFSISRSIDVPPVIETVWQEAFYQPRRSLS